MMIHYHKYFPSRLPLKILKQNTQNTMFKESINKRKKKLGKIFYKGWDIEYYETYQNILIPFINLYFIVEGKKYFDKKNKKYKRPKYLQILQIPYREYHKEKFSELYIEDPIKLYSDDPSFKYYLAYALNKIGAVVLNNYTISKLGKALTVYPKIRNKKLHKELNKHFYKLIEFISTRKIERYLIKKYYLGKKAKYVYNKSYSDEQENYE